MSKLGWKKIGVSVLAAGMLLSLAACGSNKKSSTSSSSKVLKVSVDPTYKSYVNSIKSKFEKKYNVKIKLSTKAMLDEDSALGLDGPAGKGPDVTIAPYDRIGGLARQGQLAQAKLVSGRYNKLGQKTVVYNKKTYGAPITIESLVMYYNKNLVKTAPTSFNQIEKLMQNSKYAYKNDKTKNVAFLAQWTNFYNSYGVFKGYGGYVFGNNNTDATDVGLNNSGSVKALEFIQKYYKNYWPKGTQDINSNENFMIDSFTSGKTAIILDGPWEATTLNKSNIKYGVAELPKLPNGKRYQALGGGKAWVISNYSKNKGLAQKWLNYVTDNSNQTKLYKQASEIPANLTARKAAVKAGKELTTAVNNQFKYDTPLINLPEMAEVWNPAQTIVTNAANGMNAKTAADKGVKTIQQNIKQKYPKDK